MDKINIVSLQTVFEVSSFSTDTRSKSSSPLVSSLVNKNLATANRSRVSCAHYTLRASLGLITHDLASRLRVTQRSLETELLDRSYTTYY